MRKEKEVLQERSENNVEISSKLLFLQNLLDWVEPGTITSRMSVAILLNFSFLPGKVYCKRARR